MQRDAQQVGKGIVYVAPPPAIGGSNYMPHSYFSDLFDDQSFTDHGSSYRLDELATIVHDTRWQESIHQLDIYNPWAWLRPALNASWVSRAMS